MRGRPKRVPAYHRLVLHSRSDSWWPAQFPAVINHPPDTPSLYDRLNEAVIRQLVEPGLGQRIRLLEHLRPTLPPGGGASERTTPDEAVSGQDLGRALGLSRAAVHKHVDHLRSLGFSVESIAGAGYRLVRPSDDLVAGEAVLPMVLRSARPATPWTAGLPYFYQPRCESTNLVLRRAALGGRVRGDYPGASDSSRDLPAGAVAVTDHQTGGRGRLGRTWLDEPGKDLMFSVFLRPPFAPGQAHLLSLTAALAVAEALEALPGIGSGVMIKWPNDVWLEGMKVCGILLEGSMDADRLHWAIAGIGINVNSDSAALAAGVEREERTDGGARPRPISLRDYLGSGVPRAPLLAAVLDRLTARWLGLEEAGGPAETLEAIRQRDCLVGLRVEVSGGAHRPEVMAAGEARGIGSEGQLLIRQESGETAGVFAGDVGLSRVGPGRGRALHAGLPQTGPRPG